MSALRSQLLLFGGEEEVRASSPVAATAPTRPPRSPSDPPPPQRGAFPPDPWDALSEQTVRELEEARGSDRAVRSALCRYFKRGFAASYDNGELIDLLCISNDLLAEAGYEDAEARRIIDVVLPSLTDREIEKTPLD